MEARKTSSNPSVERWSTCYVEMQIDLSGVTESLVRANSFKAQRFVIVPKSKAKNHTKECGNHQEMRPNI